MTTVAELSPVLERSRQAEPPLSLDRLMSLMPEFDDVSFSECIQRDVLVARDDNRSLVAIVTDGVSTPTLDWVRARLRLHARGPSVRRARGDDLRTCLAAHEGRMRAITDAVHGDQQRGGEDDASAISLASIGHDTNVVVRLVNSTLYDALKLQASDIHLECEADGLRVSYRIDGVLVFITQARGMDLAEQVVSRVKVLAELDIAERRVPQDGRFRATVGGREVDFRVSVMPNIYGEDVVIRLLDRQSLAESASSLRLSSLGLDESTIEAIRSMAAKPHGMLLVTGPTGSGKTTTLYATITEIHTGRDKIVTIEDPVEYRLPRVLQIPVNEKKGLTFARGLRSILRHDPDRIMVGEIRDPETAQIAVQAALTGHLVLTTVHANTAFDVLGRLLNMGVDAYSFSSALNGIVAQRLLRLVCGHCAAPSLPTPEALTSAGLRQEDVKNWHHRLGRGCASCRGTGYKGRKAIAETLMLDDETRELIAGSASVAALRTAAEARGQRSLREAALQCAAEGRTTLEEVIRVVG